VPLSFCVYSLVIVWVCPERGREFDVGRAS
jgi:hypothetical protein